MRWTMAISVALLLTLGAYAGSAAVSLQGLVRAAQSGDAAAVMSRTDLPRLKRSLVDQIVAAYLNRIGQKRAVKPLERLAANTYGVSIAGRDRWKAPNTGAPDGTPEQRQGFVGRFLSWGNGPAFAGGPLKAPRNCETN